MSDTRNPSTCFETLHNETLPSLGIDDPIYAQAIAARLLIERLGERDANYWWDSQVLSEFGRDTLEETVPRTATRSRIDLAMQVGHKVENEVIDEAAVSLFDLGPFVESHIQRELEEINGHEDLSFIEGYSTELVDRGWTEQLLSEEFTVNPGPNRTFEIGSLDIQDLQTREVLKEVVSQLIFSYGEATKDELKIPYYRVKR